MPVESSLRGPSEGGLLRRQRPRSGGWIGFRGDSRSPTCRAALGVLAAWIGERTSREIARPRARNHPKGSSDCLGDADSVSLFGRLTIECRAPTRIVDNPEYARQGRERRSANVQTQENSLSVQNASSSLPLCTNTVWYAFSGVDQQGNWAIVYKCHIHHRAKDAVLHLGRVAILCRHDRLELAIARARVGGFHRFAEVGHVFLVTDVTK
mmetsp:Transcript_36164/g.82038  ORF Transcript_36164/g.82038 Transcript_36164/m.82038 type:complete len:210 (-) Transcript_36164:344-973(-)